MNYGYQYILVLIELHVALSTSCLIYQVGFKKKKIP